MFEKFEKSDLTYNSPDGEKIKFIDKDRAKLPYNLLLEELNEYNDALENDDTVDVMYSIYGTAAEHGMKDKLDLMFSEV